MKGSASGTCADQSVDCGYVRLIRQPVRVKSSLQQVESVRVRLERKEAAVILHPRGRNRSEEHTSELQSHLNLVCRLLLEKTNMHQRAHIHTPLPKYTPTNT